MSYIDILPGLVNKRCFFYLTTFVEKSSARLKPKKHIIFNVKILHFLKKKY